MNAHFLSFCAPIISFILPNDTTKLDRRNTISIFLCHYFLAFIMRQLALYQEIGRAGDMESVKSSSEEEMQSSTFSSSFAASATAVRGTWASRRPL
mmetsp:Transcript_62678/g.74203  ORF Transcript_62678/g.74203 Transcript_62678/m.74203 type:complete len:96 (+) Transcript_62678:633-920(+)